MGKKKCTKTLSEVISPEEAQRIFRSNGLIFNREQVSYLLDFMAKIAKLVVEEYENGCEDS